MSYKALNVQKKQNIIVIQIIDCGNDQAKLIQLFNELEELYSQIVWDEDVWGVVITGDRKEAFCFGIDFTDAASRRNGGERIRFSSICEPIARLDRPVIAAIPGDAIEQGLELALTCDLRIATDESHFGLPQIKSGFLPWDGGTQRLARLVGRGKALEMILTGEIINAQEAYRIGLIHKVVPPKELMEGAMNVAQEMASKGPIALRYAKEAIYKGMDLTLEQGLRLEADLYLLIHTTKDRTEGIQAFREKRPPRFEGK
jgi:enoyl-CoA hydratase